MKIALSVVLALLIIGCSSETPKEEKVLETKKVTIVEERSTFEKTTDEVTKVNENVKEATKELVVSVKDTVAKIETKTIDAELLYSKCSGCHGSLGERVALGKSAIIGNWPAKQIEQALLGYQVDTYGSTMKTMMQSQVKDLSVAEIKALSKYISEK